MVANQNGVEDGPQPPPIFPTLVQNVSSVNWERVLYVVFDLETTGRCRQRDDIIELSAQVLDPSGIQSNWRSVGGEQRLQSHPTSSA